VLAQAVRFFQEMWHEHGMLLGTGRTLGGVIGASGSYALETVLSGVPKHYILVEAVHSPAVISALNKGSPSSQFFSHVTGLLHHILTRQGWTAERLAEITVETAGPDILPKSVFFSRPYDFERKHFHVTEAHVIEVIESLGLLYGRDWHHFVVPLGFSVVIPPDVFHLAYSVRIFP
jgi:hypothetical protein